MSARNKLNQKHAISFQRIALLSMSIIALPLFLSIILFSWYTLETQRIVVQNSHKNILNIYRNQLEDTFYNGEIYLANTVANSPQFQNLMHSRTHTDTYIHSIELGNRSEDVLYSNPLIGGFFTYSSTFDYYHMSYNSATINPAAEDNTDIHLWEDRLKIKETVINAGSAERTASGWQPIQLSNRVVFLFFCTVHSTVAAIMVDPSRQEYLSLDPDCEILYIDGAGLPYNPETRFSGKILPMHSGVILQDKNDTAYTLTSLPLTAIPGYIVYASLSSSLFNELDSLQQILLIFTLCLTVSVPICWFVLRRTFLDPMTRLSDTSEKLRNGEKNQRVAEDSVVQEVEVMARTVNFMLDTIQQQKIAVYEQQLEVQSAQLQYLQLQIRPHFFLNCLNLIYSLSEEQKYGDLQTLIIDLSTYLRSIFKDSSKLVPLREEIASVDSYIRIQRAGNPVPPRLWLMIDADAPQAEIPPLSILTFVENAVKHARPPADLPLAIRIQCSLLHSPAGDYLNASVCDNGGGFTQEQLREFNHPHDDLYTDRHVGIANIRHRFRLLYGDRAALFFRNLTDGACVELVLPLNQKKTGDDLP